MIFRWEPPLYQPGRSAAICDIAGHRLHVRRAARGLKRFHALIDGNRFGGDYTSLDEAKTVLEKHFSLQRCPTCGFPVVSFFDHVDRDGIDPDTGECK